MRRIVQVGLGPVGVSLARTVVERVGLELVGAADSSPDLAGRDLGEILGLGRFGVLVGADAGEVVDATNPDIVLHATSSHLPEAEAQIRALLSKGVSVISTCEELSYPFYRHPALAQELDAIAVDRGVILLGTGVNPGFVMDKLVATLLGACRSVDRVRVRRVVDASLRRGPLQKKIGAGITVSEFEDRARAGRIGHVGLAESAHMLADVLGVGAERVVSERLAPRIAERAVRTDFVLVEPGQVAGVEHLVVVEAGGRERVRLALEMFVGAQSSVDEVAIDGSPSLEMTIPGGIHGDQGTANVVVNCACLLDRLAPGLRTMLDVPLRLALEAR